MMVCNSVYRLCLVGAEVCVCVAVTQTDSKCHFLQEREGMSCPSFIQCLLSCTPGAVIGEVAASA